MTGITFNDDELKQLMVTALLTHIGEDQRNMLVKEALANLLEMKQSSQYGYGKTNKLLEAFNVAMWDIARDTAKELLQSDDTIKEKIRELLAKVFTKLMDSDDAVEGISTAIAKAFNRAAEY